MKYLSIDEIKSLQLDILKKFADYCDKHNLEYFLVFGTLIGAVRHKGFIPWDDDIDVAMPRADYERLFQLVNEEPIAPNLKLQCSRTDKTSNVPYLKIVDTRTNGREEWLREEITCGVFIDVFVVDYLPVNPKEKKIQQKKMKRLDRKLTFSSRRFIPCKNPLKLLKRSLLYLLYHHIDYNDIANKIDQLATAYQTESPHTAKLVQTAFCSCTYNANLLSGTILMDFEQYQFKCPLHYHEYLTDRYGDYMALPPESERVYKHQFTAWWVDDSRE